LDDKEKPLTTVNGEKIYRNMVQFHRLSDFENEETLVEKTLQNVQKQILEYCKQRGI